MSVACAALALALLPSPRLPAPPPRRSQLRHPTLVAIVPDALQSEPAIVPDALQSEAIKSASNSVLLLASPGTGKTRVLRARMAYLLLRERVPPEKILAVTFTQHAAHELPHAISDKMTVGVLRVRRVTAAVEDGVHAAGQVTERIEQSTVEIEDHGLDGGRVHASSGVT